MTDLCKFRKIDSYTFDMIDKAQLFFSHPTNFNDPFEGVHQPSKKECVQITHPKAVLCLTNSPQNIQIGTNFNPQFSDDEILLWSHYADEHRGVKFVFDKKILKEHFDGLAELIPVDYKKPEDPFPENPVLTEKAACWKYEDESRFIFNNAYHKNSKVEVVDRGFLISYPFHALKAIYFGCRTTPADMQKFYCHISKKITDPSEVTQIHLVKLKMSPLSYKLEIESHTTINNGHQITVNALSHQFVLPTY